MVRVGGGWEELDKFLSRYDPCRGIHGINNDITLDTWQMADYITTDTGERRTVTKHLETTMNFTNKTRASKLSNLNTTSSSLNTTTGNSTPPTHHHNDNHIQTSTPRRGDMTRNLSNLSARSVQSNTSGRSTRSRSKIPIRNGRHSKPGSRASSVSSTDRR